VLYEIIILNNMKIVVLNYTGYRQNWGSQATSRGLLQIICRIFGDLRGVKIDVVPYPPSFILDYWDEWINSSYIRDVLIHHDNSVESLRRFEKLCALRFSYMLDRLKDADIVFFQGEGAIGGRRQFDRVQLFGLPVLAKLVYKKKVISINQTIAYSSEHELGYLKKIYSLFDLNFVRELQSFNLCSGEAWPEFGYLPDAAFTYVPHGTGVDIPENKSYFCITGSAHISSYDVRSYANNIKILSDKWGLTPVFIYSRSGDSAIAKEYEKYGDNFKVICHQSHPDVDDVIPILRSAAVVIGGRYHTSISALTQNTPVILTRSNSHKSDGLVKQFEGSVRLVDHANNYEMISAMGQIMNNRELLQSNIKVHLADIRRQSDEVIDRLKTSLCGSPEVSRKRDRGELMPVIPEFTLENSFRLYSRFKSISRSVNLGIYDRPGF
jgi:polysaccharide pyruvyl transferase WcaK-like protein